MRKSYTIPSGDLTLPNPPKDHQWVVETTISSTVKGTNNGVTVRLVNAAGVTVVTVTETWNPKLENIADFVVSVAGVTIVHLDAYNQFMAVSWEQDNPILDAPTEENYSNNNIRTWNHKP